MGKYVIKNKTCTRGGGGGGGGGYPPPPLGGGRGYQVFVPEKMNVKIKLGAGNGRGSGREKWCYTGSVAVLQKKI